MLIIGLGAGVVAFMLGALWYTVLFGKLWLKEVGLTEEEIKARNGSVMPMIGTLVIEIAVAFLIIYVSTISSLSPVYTGVVVGGIAVLSSLKNYLFEQKSFRLVAINESYKFICILIMAIAVQLFY